jgi:hypothetical protein
VPVFEGLDDLSFTEKGGASSRLTAASVFVLRSSNSLTHRTPSRTSARAAAAGYENGQGPATATLGAAISGRR